MSTFYQGGKLRFKFDNLKLLHATNCKISVSKTLEEISTKDTDGKVVIPSNYAWNGSTDCLLSNLPVGNTANVTADDLLEKLLAGTEVDVDFTTDETGDVIYSGKVYIENFEVTAENEASAKVTISFRGNGNLDRAVV